MDKYIVNGGNALDGKIVLQKSKNAALPLLAASILTTNEVSLIGVPRIDDVKNMVRILENLGCRANGRQMRSSWTANRRIATASHTSLPRSCARLSSY